jgi:uncharacterized protein YjbJ (UPF0337 family)
MNAAGREQAGNGPAPAAGVPESQTLEQEIQQTREQLGETVAELAARADVKARAKAKAQQLTSQLKARAGQARERAASQAEDGARRGVQPLQRATGRAAVAARQEPVLLAVAGGATAVGIVLIVWGIRQ